MQASDVMVRDVVTVRPDATVKELAQLLIDRGISGAPVVDAQGKLLGMVTEGDLIRRVELGTEGHRSRWVEYFVGPEFVAEDFIKARAVRVADLMTRNPVSVSENADLRQVADLLERRRVKRLPVLRDGKIVGIISRSNLVQALASLPPTTLAERSPGDRELRERVLQEIRLQPFGMPWRLSAVVDQGVVELWGSVSSETERRAVRVAVETVPGVRKVHDNTTVRPVSYAAA